MKPGEGEWLSGLHDERVRLLLLDTGVLPLVEAIGWN